MATLNVLDFRSAERWVPPALVHELHCYSLLVRIVRACSLCMTGCLPSQPMRRCKTTACTTARSTRASSARARCMYSPRMLTARFAPGISGWSQAPCQRSMILLGCIQHLPGLRHLISARMPPPRNMRSPVFEEQQLSHYSALMQYNAPLPLMPPFSPARSQGLQLSTNDDALIGRADNGMIRACFHQATHEQTPAPRHHGCVCDHSLLSTDCTH